jgi:hypothetical protein
MVSAVMEGLISLVLGGNFMPSIILKFEAKSPKTHCHNATFYDLSWRQYQGHRVANLFANR